MRNRVLFCAMCALMFVACGSEDSATTKGNNDTTVNNTSTDTTNNTTGGETSGPDTSTGPMCGDGMIEGDELCDGDCPADISACPMPDAACITAVYNGAPETCDAACSVTEITMCTDGDGCCPSSCDAMSDSDCQMGPVCGDGMVEGDEVCDGDCPMDAAMDCPDPADACTAAIITGEQCQAMCATAEITACADDDGCCPMNCTNADDNDCAAAMCGNGMVEPGETCDGDCPTTANSCDDFNACTTDSVMGMACQRECAHDPITMCVDGDGCCPMGCDGMDTDCGDDDLCGAPLPPVAEPASVASSIQVASSSCCFDYDGDNTPDNQLNQVLGLLMASNSTNASLTQSINSGEFALVFEHEGLTSASNQSSFTINVLQGTPQCFMAPDAAGENVYTIKPTSYDAMGAPVATLPNATITNGALTTGYGDLPLVISFNGAVLDIPISDAQLSADVDATATQLPNQGVALVNGNIGGVIGLTDFYDSLNAYVSTSCGCLSNPNNVNLVSYTGPRDPMCDSSITPGTCTMDGGVQEACLSLLNTCGAFGFLPTFADAKVDAPAMSCGRNCDAISLGINFTAAGARIR